MKQAFCLCGAGVGAIVINALGSALWDHGMHSIGSALSVVGLVCAGLAGWIFRGIA